MASYTIFNTTTGEILVTGTCPTDQISNLIVDDGTGIYIGKADERSQKIDVNTLLPVDKTSDELLTWDYAQKINKKPNIFNINDIDDSTLNSIIESFYLNQVTAATWRIENYAYLRKLAYPDYKDVYLDAMVKMSSTNQEIQTEGALQLQQYYADCLAVKERFPKE